MAAIQAQVATVVRGLLGGEVSADAPLMESGLDSLGADMWHGGIVNCHSLTTTAI